MLGGMFSSWASAMCLRTVSEYWKRPPQIRQCHWSRAKVYGRHSGPFESSGGIFKSCDCSCAHARRLARTYCYPTKAQTTNPFLPNAMGSALPPPHATLAYRRPSPCGLRANGPGIYIVKFETTRFVNDKPSVRRAIEPFHCQRDE
jgi:hypothetical protein